MSNTKRSPDFPRARCSKAASRTRNLTGPAGAIVPLRASTESFRDQQCGVRISTIAGRPPKRLVSEPGPQLIHVSRQLAGLDQGLSGIEIPSLTLTKNRGQDISSPTHSMSSDPNFLHLVPTRPQLVRTDPGPFGQRNDSEILDPNQDEAANLSRRKRRRGAEARSPYPQRLSPSIVC